MKQIFPIEILENTTHVHQFEHRKKSSAIYSVSLLILIISLALLPFIKVDIFTTAKGLLKTKKGRVNLTLISSGKVLKSNIENNKYVNKGDTLLILDDHNLKSKLSLISFNIEKTKRHIHDAAYLIKDKGVNQDNLQSKIYKKEYLQYLQKLEELQIRLEKVKRDFYRNRRLFSKGVIARITLENSKFEYDMAIGSITKFRVTQSNLWQIDLTRNLGELKALENEYQLQIENRELYTVKAPIKGTLHNAIGIENGSLVNAGVTLAEISPDDNLIVECYISSKDIGLLKIENPVKYQIEAFNYNHWGLATGIISEIGNDIEIINETPVFKVHCTIDQSYLTLKNNYKGYLKKGMTLIARFKITERSLFDLLYDNIDDWLNPTNQKNNEY